MDEVCISYVRAGKLSDEVKPFNDLMNAMRIAKFVVVSSMFESISKCRWYNTKFYIEFRPKGTPEEDMAVIKPLVNKHFNPSRVAGIDLKSKRLDVPSSSISLEKKKMDEINISFRKKGKILVELTHFSDLKSDIENAGYEILASFFADKRGEIELYIKFRPKGTPEEDMAVLAPLVNKHFDPARIEAFDLSPKPLNLPQASTSQE